MTFESSETEHLRLAFFSRSRPVDSFSTDRGSERESKVLIEKERAGLPKVKNQDEPDDDPQRYEHESPLRQGRFGVFGF
jgi:hypothetical protein